MKISASHGRPQKFFQGGATSKFCLSFTGCWRCHAHGRSRSALLFLPHQSVLVEPQFSIVCLKCFLHFGYQKCFSFHQLPNIHFFKHLLQLSHNLRIFKVHNNMSGEKTLSQNCFKQWEVKIYVDKTIGHLTEVRTPRRFKKTEQLNYENSRQQI